MVKLSKIIPSGPEVARETIVVLCGLLLAAYIISKFPRVQKFVAANSLTVKNEDGKVLF